MLWRILVTPSLKRFNVREALTQPPNGHLRFRSLSSSRLQPASRFPHTPTPIGTTGASLGLFPFQRHHCSTRKQASTLAAARPQVFTTSRQDRRRLQLAGLFHPAGTPRVMVFRAYLPNDRRMFPCPCFFAVSCSSWLPSAHLKHFPVLDRRDLPLTIT